MFKKEDRIEIIEEDRSNGYIFKVGDKGRIMNPGHIASSVEFDDGRVGYVFNRNMKKIDHIMTKKEKLAISLRRGDLIIINKNVSTNLREKNKLHMINGGNREMSKELIEFAGKIFRTLSTVDNSNEIAIEVVSGEIDYVPLFAIRRPYRKELEKYLGDE